MPHRIGFLTATLVANVVGYWRCRQRVRWELGLSGYNAVMLGLALGHYLRPAWLLFLLAVLAGVGSALLVDLIDRYFSRLVMPVLGLPFLAVGWPLLARASPAGRSR